MSSKDLISNALLEDMPSGDLTTESLALTSTQGQARLVAKEDLVLSGMLLFEETVSLLEPEAQLKWQFKDGDFVLRGQNIALIKGDLVQILKAERVALNFLGHLSGIATLTRCYVERVSHTQCKILDTRKTTPGLRHLEKRAVRDGGGTNHRMNLSESILIKENHIRAAGGMTEAISRIRKHVQSMIEVETLTIEDVEEAVRNKVDRILLDNMDNETLKKALQIIPSQIETEASGNMVLSRVSSVAELGVSYISVGALTHSAPNADLSLLFDWT